MDCIVYAVAELDTTERLSLLYLNGRMVFPTFFNLRLNFEVRSS